MRPFAKLITKHHHTCAAGTLLSWLGSLYQLHRMYPPPAAAATTAASSLSWISVGRNSTNWLSTEAAISALKAKGAG